MEAHEKGEVLTGVFHIDTQKPNFVDLLNMTDTPLAHLPQATTRPAKRALDEVMESLR